MNVLVIGATGNVGREVVNALSLLNHNVNIVSGVRNVPRAKEALGEIEGVNYKRFDFDDFHTFESALSAIDIVFLLRPPHVTDIDKCFVPLFEAMKANHVNKVVFLSVQGAEKSKIIPHNKIEGLIKAYKFEAVHLRPSYFMQNLTTTLKADIEKGLIQLPSKEAKFNWIDIKDIGEVAARVIIEFDHYKGRAIELTGQNNMSFRSVIESINEELNLTLDYRNVNPVTYYRLKKSEGYEKGQIIVMLMLHLLPRFQKEPIISGHVKSITGHDPISIREFAKRNTELFRGLG